jgi:hypothetical protein
MSAQDIVMADVSSPNIVQKRTDLIQRCRAEYGNSDIAAAVRTRLRQALDDTARECDTAVMVGLGKLDTTDSDIRPVWQLVLFLDIVEHLSSEQKKRRYAEDDETDMNMDDGPGPAPLLSPVIKMYAQDPVFRPLEKEILASFGIEVVANPAARKLITPSTFLFAPFVHWMTVLRYTISTSDPMLYIGANLTEVIELLEHYDRT